MEGGNDRRRSSTVERDLGYVCVNRIGGTVKREFHEVPERPVAIQVSRFWYGLPERKSTASTWKSTMNYTISQHRPIWSVAPAGVPDDGVVHVDQLAKNPL